MSDFLVINGRNYVPDRAVLNLVDSLDVTAAALRAQLAEQQNKFEILAMAIRACDSDGGCRAAWALGILSAPAAERVKCSRCGGSGNNDDSDSTDDSQCPKCHGSGKGDGHVSA